MKILYVLDKMHHFAGTERILTFKMNYLADHTRHQVYFTTYEQGEVSLPFSLSEKVAYIPLEAVIASRESLTFTRWILAYVGTRKQFRKKLDNLLTSLVPDILICTAYSFNVLDIILLQSERHGVKTVVESHTKAATILLSEKYAYNRFIYPVMKLWDRFLLRGLNHGTCLVTLTRADAIFWNKYISRVEIIPNMITISSSDVYDYTSKNMISVGRYSYEKGFDRLIEAWSLVADKYPDWKLHMYGNGDKTVFENLIKSYQLENSVFCMPATDDILSKYINASIYVMSSRYEGFGLVLTEAMSCGLPCVAFDCPYGPSEIIDDGKDGYLVENGNVYMLADKLKKLMADSDLRRKMGKMAKINVVRYSKQNIMARWITLLEEL